MPSKQNTTEIFSDFTTDFMVHPVSGDLVVKKNADSIKQSLRNLILHNFYDRPFRPLIGTDITNLLFEPANNMTAQIIENAITTTINNYEPRVALDTVHISPSPDSNRYDVTILFTIININEQASLDVTLNRIR